MKNLFAFIFILVSVASFTPLEKKDIILNLKDEDRLTIKYSEASSYIQQMPSIHIYKKDDFWIGTFDGQRSFPKKVKLTVEDMHRLVAFEQALYNEENAEKECDRSFAETVYYQFDINGNRIWSKADPTCTQDLFTQLTAAIFDLEEIDYKPIALNLL